MNCGPGSVSATAVHADRPSIIR